MAEKSLKKRKFALDEVLVMTQNPKLASGDYSKLILVLENVVAEDNNTLLVAKAARCLAGLARGLGEQVSCSDLGFFLTFCHLTLLI